MCNCLPIINLNSFDRGREYQTSPALEAAVAGPGCAHDARAWLLQHNPQQDCSYKDHKIEQIRTSGPSPTQLIYGPRQAADGARRHAAGAAARLAWLLQLRQDERLIDVGMQQDGQENLCALTAA
jgi:hypothetical protein